MLEFILVQGFCPWKLRLLILMDSVLTWFMHGIYIEKEGVLKFISKLILSVLPAWVLISLI